MTKRKRKIRKGDEVIVRPPKEDADQQRVVEWRDIWAVRYPKLKLLHASLNGVHIPIHYAMKLKRMGMVSGIPDLFLPVKNPRQGPGLYIEMKRRDGSGVVSDEQKEIIGMLAEEEYVVKVCDTWEGAVTELMAWVGITEPEARPGYGREAFT